MTPAEVANRVLRVMQARAERSGLFGARRVPEPDLAAAGNPWVFADARVKAEPYVAAADRISHGLLDLFAMRSVQMGLSLRTVRTSASAVISSPGRTGARKLQSTWRNTLPGPGRSSATSAFKIGRAHV